MKEELNKKQIVFIEPKPTVTMYRVARSLKQTGKYETILFSFSELDREFYEKAYDKIFILDLSHKIKTKDLFDFSKRILNGKVKSFLEKIKKMRPYLFNITGPDLFVFMAMSSLIKNPSPKIYYPNDIWGALKKNYFFTKEFWIKGEFQKFFEKICFKMADGVLNKGAPQHLDLLNYSISVPRMALPSYCLDAWMFPPRKKKNKEIHVAFGASPAHPLFLGELSHIEIIKTITSQKIHLHTYGPCFDEKENKIFVKESKKNKYYHFHGLVKPGVLNKEMSKYNYGIFLFFMDPVKGIPFTKLAKPMLNSKMINYLESGLPIIINKQYEYMAGIIEKHGLGLAIDAEDLKNLRKILEQKDYSQFQKNIKKFQKEFCLSKKIKEIEAFYDKIVKIKTPS